MGNLLGAPVTEKETERGTTVEGPEDERVRFAVSSMQGWRVHMEDAHITEARLYAAEPSANAASTWNKLDLPGHSLFAVFDGHGGSYSALYAGRNLCRVLSRQSKFVQYAKLVQSNNNNNSTSTPRLGEMVELLKGALTDAFVDMDKEIFLALLKGTKVPDADTPYHDDQPTSHHPAPKPTTDINPTMALDSTTPAANSNNSVELLEEEGNSGTTACVVLVTPHCILCANAGDSRGILRQLNGRTMALSFDHKPEDEGEEGRIRAAGGYVTGGRVEGDLAVSRGLGDFRFKDATIVQRGSGNSLDPVLLSQPTDTMTLGNANNNNNNNIFMPSSSPTVQSAGDQKVSPIPDVLANIRDASQDAFAMIACDGIWDVQTNEHASKLVHDVFSEGEVDVGLVCEEVCDICLRLGSKDNMTVLVLQFPGYTQRLRQQQQQGQPQGPSTPTGVMSRRQAREAEHNNLNNSNTTMPLSSQ